MLRKLEMGRNWMEDERISSLCTCEVFIDREIHYTSYRDDSARALSSSSFPDQRLKLFTALFFSALAPTAP